MATVTAPSLIARNPSTGEEIGRIACVAPDEVHALVSGAQLAAMAWSARPIRERIEVVRGWWNILCRDAEKIAVAIQTEIGKPLPEALMEVGAGLDAIRWVVKNGRSTLAETRIGPGWQRLALMGAARLRWAPLGVVGIIGTWNYPFLLDAPAIAGALVAGNGIAWKPSELCPHVADLLRHSLIESQIPPGLIASLFGGRDVGEALTASDIDKAFFTGGSANGHAIASKFAGRGVPMVAELSGFDAAIVLPDAPLESTAKALSWGAFIGSGQTCVAVKRIYVVGDEHQFLDALARNVNSLRVGNPSGEVDLGPMISEDARTRFHERIEEAVVAGAEIVCGGEPISGAGSFYRPTVLSASHAEPERLLEGIFGPVTIVRGFESEDLAIAAANASSFGLAASVWGWDRRRCRVVADALRAGSVSINDAVTPTGLAAAPFGGTKGSGYGRVRGALGLREFAAPQVFHERGPGGYRPQLFPYSSRFSAILTFYRRLFHRPS